jgi:transposase
MPSLDVHILEKLITMAKSSQTRKQLAEDHRAKCKKWSDIFAQSLDEGVLSISIEIVYWINLIIGRFQRLLPSEKAPVEAITRFLNLMAKIVEGVTELVQVLITAEKNAELMVPTDSTNSHKPRSKDVGPTKRKKPKREKKEGGGRKPGGQKGHKGSSLKLYPNPDKVVRLKIDPSKLPPGNWEFSHVEVHQVVKVKIIREVIQIESEVFVNRDGEEYKKTCPKEYEASEPDVVKKCGLDANGNVVPLDGGDDNLAESPRADAETIVPTGTSAEADEAQTPDVEGESDSSGHTAEANEVKASDLEDDDDLSKLVAESQDRPVSNFVKEQGAVTRFSMAEIFKKGSKTMVRAAFPVGAKAPIQYDKSVKAISTFYSVYQMIPFQRLHETFRGIFGINLSTGSICDFRVEAADRLVELGFSEWAKNEIIGSDAIYVDETGINVLGKQNWFHIAVSEKAVYGKVLESRSGDAIESIGILPVTGAVITHDHYAAYDRFDQTLHSLCNAHLLRELKGLEEKCGLKWPVVMTNFLHATKKEVDDAGGELSDARRLEVRDDFLAILQKAEEECPPEKRPPWKKRGRAPKSKGRHMVERLRKDIDDVLRFMTSEAVSFTNNEAERALRMQKVHLKISGCFRNLTSANRFVLIRCYLMTCERNGIDALDALKILFSGKLPSFFKKESSETQTPPDTAHLSNPLVSQAA